MAGEVEQCDEEWRAACAELNEGRERLRALRDELRAQERQVVRLTEVEVSARSRLHMKNILARTTTPAAAAPATAEPAGECRPVEIVGHSDDDGGRYYMRADGTRPDIYRVYDRTLRSIVHCGPDEAAAFERLALLRAAERPGRLPRLRAWLTRLVSKPRTRARH